MENEVIDIQATLLCVAAVVGFMFLFGWVWHSTRKQLLQYRHGQDNAKRAFEKCKKEDSYPTTFLPVSKFEKDLKDTYDLNSEVLYLKLLELAEEGNLKFTGSELNIWMASYRIMQQEILRRRNESTIARYFLYAIYFTMFVSAIVAIFENVLLILLVVVVIWFFTWQRAIKVKNATKMEKAFVAYLNGTALNQISASSGFLKENLTVTQEIINLQNLKNCGSITDTEFDQLKKKIIG